MPYFQNRWPLQKQVGFFKQFLRDFIDSQHIFVPFINAAVEFKESLFNKIQFSFAQAIAFVSFFLAECNFCVEDQVERMM